MGLKDLRLNDETVIETSGSSFAVRGIDLMGLVGLIARNRGTMPKLFDSIVAGGKPDAEQAMEIGAQLIATVPELAADIIATASEGYTPDNFQVCLRLPAPAQIEALEAIGKLTFASEGGPKKFMETVIRLARGTTNLVSQSA